MAQSLTGDGTDRPDGSAKVYRKPNLSPLLSFGRSLPYAVFLFTFCQTSFTADPFSSICKTQCLYQCKICVYSHDIPQNLDLLNKWTIPKVNIKTIYDYGWFDKISNKQLIKTTEQSLALNSSEQIIRLLNKRDIELYKSQYKFVHIDMVQIAFKPLTLKGLLETFLAALRDARDLNF
ncbi:hypothetical protein H5410_053166 [Solanum commersonii]|uniref:Uncharacterized protein n=1 Tax=Solanum commersonii TaxID=4109 RepID=A0A9J5X343_SOLCO|nr:hypothetical protein H5410_053166 [Solanum commersonii]